MQSCCPAVASDAELVAPAVASDAELVSPPWPQGRMQSYVSCRGSQMQSSLPWPQMQKAGVSRRGLRCRAGVSRRGLRCSAGVSLPWPQDAVRCSPPWPPRRRKQVPAVFPADAVMVGLPAVFPDAVMVSPPYLRRSDGVPCRGLRCSDGVSPPWPRW
ncbi:hypothetical protein AVEN_190055-1 [Araneus ventricosus]|uniref:Uncharacterized protein n=1 Tax=Araneus ventricosus TaxID=182803 RepID=A0A4Y2MRA8_ARAVE|nr:hypothetical protein AVEN_190055-1 [Araneus ventricosus]